ncbi:MAG: 4Fe-4S binding protein [Leptolyngbyaceae cyanobacterium bins.59]|nr:4Fe-4S binding protein [Leptolyngbyaceae cyanobacterium bins.59]
MAYQITNQCIQCDRCQGACPTGAVQKIGQRYVIQSDLCNNCESDHGVPQCWSVCPTNGACIPDAQAISAQIGDYWESWFKTYDRMMSRLRTAQQSEYWENWFDAYSRELSNLPTRKPRSVEVNA